MRALLHEPGLVHHQHATGLAEVLGDIAGEVVADGVGVPGGPGQQVLDPVGGRVAEVFG